MGFGGSAAAMVQSIKSNLAQKRSNRYGKKNRDTSYKVEKTEYNFAKVSEEELSKIKRKIAYKAKIRKNKETLLFIGILLAIIIIGIVLLS